MNIDQDLKKTIRDSSKYQAIAKFSEKSKFTRFIHRLIFKPIGRDTVPQPKKSKIKKPQPYLRLEGKIIRHIQIITLDPFGYSISDTSIHPGVVLMKAGNSVHLVTLPKIIKNLLLFNENELYDSMLVAESERLIVLHSYVREVSFNTFPTPR